MRIVSLAILLAASVIWAAGECGGIFLADEMEAKEALTGLIMGHPFWPKRSQCFPRRECMLLNRVCTSSGKGFPNPRKHPRKKISGRRRLRLIAYAHITPAGKLEKITTRRENISTYFLCAWDLCVEGREDL